VLKKFLTIDPETGKIINQWLDMLRRLGIDELPQLLNVIDEDMSVCGRRPVVAAEHEEIMDHIPPKLHRPWLQVVDGSRPGIVSSYGLYHHEHPIAGPEDYGIRAELDIKDYVDGSLAYDVRLLGRFAAMAVGNKFS
jgi:lipopolysaccharide/colanic/teichoic acid biosynthesis glycosyltransferase